MRLTRGLQQCTAEKWRENGAEGVDLARLAGKGQQSAWWNSLLNHALSVWEGDDLDELDSEGWGAMHLAAEYGLVWALEGLVKLGANIDLRSR